MNTNKKGFTLVEILSVIVILSVVVLIATNAVIPSMTIAKKQVLATEANTIILGAKTLYAQEGNTTTKCYSYQDIIDSGLISKNDSAYSGSFLIETTSNGSYTYKIWLSNGTYMVDGKSPDITADDVVASGENASTVCNVE